MNQGNIFKFSLVLLLLIGCAIGDEDPDNAITDDENENETEIENEESVHNKLAAESHLSAHVYALLEHYKQEDPIGIPGVPIPDPMPVPDTKKSLTFGTNLEMTNSFAYGLSKFRLKYLKTDLKALMVNSAVQLDKMEVKGDYSLTSLFTDANGPYFIELKDVLVIGNASLGVEKDGKVRTQNIAMDISFADMSMDFQNLGLLGTVFQSIANTAPTFIFDTMKPFMLQEAYTKISAEIDANLEKFLGDRLLPNSISPFDMAIAEMRKKVRQMGYDPYKVEDYNHTVGVFSMQMTNTWISGLSSFYRAGDITVTIQNNTVIMEVHIGTQKIEGATQWELSVGGGMITRAGQTQFTIQYFKGFYVVSQSLDTRNRPKIENLQMELGNIQVRCDGAGILDYVSEALVNILPNLLRYQIMDAIENPLKQRIQQMMDKIDVEHTIKQKIPEFEKLGVKMNIDFKFPM